MKIAVVGAGIAGVCATKHCLDYGYEVTAFEKTNIIGGTWVYTDNVGKDEFGIDVHTSMYQNLRSNFPKEIMVDKCIKFRHEIIITTEVMVRDLVDDSIEMELFDAVMCCNGHYSCPRIPEFTGQESYKGKILHTHDFRTPDIFKDEKVLVIGSGASGIDVAYFVSKVATKTTISYQDPMKAVPDGIYKKSDVKQLTENGAIFDDETEDDFSVIILATGYMYSSPYLSIDCGITVNDNYIQPLYKHCININYPSMAFIGMPYLVHPPLISYLQIQLFLKYVSGSKPIPSKEEMLKDTNDEMESRWKNGLQKKQAHMMGLDLLGDYYDDVCRLPGLPPVKPYMMKIYRENQKDLKRDHIRFREINFTIVDDEHFEKDKEL